RRPRDGALPLRRGRVRRGLRRPAGGARRPARHDGPLREGADRRRHQPHRRRLDLRAAGGARPAPRHDRARHRGGRRPRARAPPRAQPLVVTWQFTLTGLGLGLIVGLTGVGGGSLMTPILIIVFGFKPTYAVGTDIFHGAIFKSFGAARHRRLGTVHGHLTLWLFLGSGPYVIVAALIGGGGGFLAKSFVTRGAQGSELPFIMSHRDKALAIATGAVFGFIVGLTSVGSGTYFGLVMVLAYPLTMPRVVGTDIFHAAALLWIAGVGHLIIGDVDLHATAWLLLGSVPGILISSRYTLKVPELTIRGGLGGILIISGLKLLNVPYANWVLGAGLAVLIVALAIYTAIAMSSHPNASPGRA